MVITDTHKETINLDKDSILNYTLKPNSFARLFFYDRAGVDVKINVDLEENSSCEIYGFFKNEGRDTIHKHLLENIPPHPIDIKTFLNKICKKYKVPHIKLAKEQGY